MKYLIKAISTFYTLAAIAFLMFKGDEDYAAVLFKSGLLFYCLASTIENRQLIKKIESNKQ